MSSESFSCHQVHCVDNKNMRTNNKRGVRELNAAFKKDGRSIRAFARELGISRTYMKMLLEGEWPQFKLNTLHKVQKALGVKP